VNGAHPKNGAHIYPSPTPMNHAVSPPTKPSINPLPINRPTSPVGNGAPINQLNGARIVNNQVPRSKGPANNNVNIPDFMSSNSTSGISPTSQQRGTDYSSRPGITDYSGRVSNQSPTDILRESKGKAVTPTDYDNSRSTGNIAKPVFL